VAYDQHKYEILVLDGRIFSVDALLGRTPLDHYSLIPDPAAAGFSFALPQGSPLLLIWFVIKSLRDVCVIFNIHPEENQGFATLSLRRSYVVNPTRSQ